MKHLFHPFTLVVAALPFQWLSLKGLGPLSVQLPYLAILALLLSVLALPGRLRAVIAFPRYMPLVLLSFAAYLLVLMPALHGSDGQSIPYRQVVYLITFLCLAGTLLVTKSPGRLLRVSGAATLVGFIIVIEILARKNGLSWTNAIARFVGAGDLDYVIYGFLRTVFNSTAAEGQTIVASAKNGIAVAILVGVILFRAGFSGAGNDRLGWAFTGLAYFFLIMLNTRSVLVAGILALLLVSAIRVGRGDLPSVPGLILRWLIASVAVTSLVLLLTSDSAFIETLQRRLIFSDSSAGSRFDQISWALQNIETQLFTGFGYAEIDGHPVHNLFLGAWMHAGLGAFLLIVVFYLGLVAAWLRFVIAAIYRPDNWTLPIRAEWIAVLPIMPLFRVWLSGDAGHLFLGEWVALAVFFGCNFANARKINNIMQPNASAIHNSDWARA